MRRSIWVVAVLLILAIGSGVWAADVAVLKSSQNQNWYLSLGWDFDGEYRNVIDTLRASGVSYVELSDEDLAAGSFDGARVLVLVNNRMMSAAQVEATKGFVASGGRLFGLYQSSFRSDANTNVNPVNHYQLDEIYNVGYASWAGSPPMNAYIKGDVSHPIWQGLPELVPTNRYTTMVNFTLPEGHAIGEWYNADQVTKSQIDLQNAAVVVSPSAVYVSESLFDPIVYGEASVKQLAQNIIKYLLD